METIYSPYIVTWFLEIKAFYFTWERTLFSIIILIVINRGIKIKYM